MTATLTMEQTNEFSSSTNMGKEPNQNVLTSFEQDLKISRGCTIKFCTYNIISEGPSEFPTE